MSGSLDAAGIYVHVPFCLTRCGYCDFNAYAGLDHLASRYVAALLREAELAAPAWEGEEVVSVFLGGGTPTTLEVADLKALLVRLRSSFAVTADAEVTIEANPDTVDEQKLAGLRGSGLRPVVDGRAVLRPVGARGAGADPPAGVGREGVPRRSRGGLRQREPRPDLRGGGGERGVVGANARGDDRARRRST